MNHKERPNNYHKISDTGRNRSHCKLRSSLGGIDSDLSFYCLDTGDENAFEVDSKQIYRNYFLRVQQHDERERRSTYAVDGVRRPTKVQTLKRNKLLRFICWLATDHKMILEVILLLPLILMACYIVFIENGPLYYCYG